MPFVHTAVPLLPGEGTIVLSSSGETAVLSSLSYTYPLKLITPSNRFFKTRTAAVYLISYGGGLVAGDRVRLRVQVTGESCLVLLTQGSTKVFKPRQAVSLVADSPLMSDTTRQTLVCHVDALSTLVLLPAPVTCFARAMYAQKQTFHLTPQSNLVLLDWYTSGRMGRGEEWEFDLFRTENEVVLDSRTIVKDVLLLEDEREEEARGRGRTSYYERVAPYSCYCTLILFGPSLLALRQYLHKIFTAVTQNAQSRPYSLLWSYSTLLDGGGILRAAGSGTEEVKDWLIEVMSAGGIEDVIGDELWKGFRA